MPSIWKTERSESICVAQPSLDIIAWDVLSFRLRGLSITSKHPQVIMIGKIKQLFQLFSAALISCWLHWLMIHACGFFAFLVFFFFSPTQRQWFHPCMFSKETPRFQSTWSNVSAMWICAVAQDARLGSSLFFEAHARHQEDVLMIDCLQRIQSSWSVHGIQISFNFLFEQYHISESAIILNLST